ncbi:transglycosylase SLT domain-containing protein [Polynucleobacter sp. 31A-FELB]|nr:transglycosylase SLT domain-containing protein [Polynucleobacter sp. 31A-FELB]
MFRKLPRIASLVFLILSFFTPLNSVAQIPSESEIAQSPLLGLNKVMTGDFGGRMLEVRAIRVAVPYSKTFFYNDAGNEIGLLPIVLQDLSIWLNTQYPSSAKRIPFEVVAYPMKPTQLVPSVIEGRADIAMGGLQTNSEVPGSIDFVEPMRFPAKEVLVTGPSSPEISDILQLSGQTLYIRPQLRNHDGIIKLNETLRTNKKSPVKIVALPENLDDEGALEMVNAGLIPNTVTYDWMVSMWSKALPKIKPHPNIIINDDVRMGWAIRKDNPELKQVLQKFIDFEMKHSRALFGEWESYANHVSKLTDSRDLISQKRYQESIRYFQTYGAQYNFDPLMLAAMGYQESRLNQSARNPSGAIGVMQLLPSTGKLMNVGDITSLESNIHAGSKYLDYLMAQGSLGQDLSPENRDLFAFASYNAGPHNIAKARQLAIEKGLNPNIWLDNVEIAVAQLVGIQTTDYVRNIYRYYIAYRLAKNLELQEKQSDQYK